MKIWAAWDKSSVNLGEMQSTANLICFFLHFSCQTGYIKQACVCFGPGKDRTLVSHTVSPPACLRIADGCTVRAPLSSFFCVEFLYNWKGRWAPAHLSDWTLSSEARPTCTFSRDRWLRKPWTGSLAALLHNLLGNKNCVPTPWFLCNRCQLVCGGYEHEAEGGSSPA